MDELALGGRHGLERHRPSIRERLARRLLGRTLERLARGRGTRPRPRRRPSARRSRSAGARSRAAGSRRSSGRACRSGAPRPSRRRGRGAPRPSRRSTPTRGCRAPSTRARGTRAAPRRECPAPRGLRLLRRLAVELRGDTRAGVKPTPSRPRSPSEMTWKRTWLLSSPGSAARARGAPPTWPRRRSPRSPRPDPRRGSPRSVSGRSSPCLRAALLAPAHPPFGRAGGPSARRAGFGAAAPTGAVAAGVGARGGVRELRFGGTCGLGMSRRVTSPWPTVQRFVVTQ